MKFWQQREARGVDSAKGDRLAESNDLPPELEHPANKMAREAMRVERDSAKSEGEENETVWALRRELKQAITSCGTLLARAESAEAELKARRLLDEWEKARDGRFISWTPQIKMWRAFPASPGSRMVDAPTHIELVAALGLDTTDGGG